jgi:predicted nucleic acid-binding protein
VLLYLDTSAVLRAVLEEGTDSELEGKIGTAELLLTSRLSLVECARAFHRLRHQQDVSEQRVSEAERDADAIWSRCEIWELTRAVCELACNVAPAKGLRTLDALQLATYLIARRRLEGLELLTVDRRLRSAIA